MEEVKHKNSIISELSNSAKSIYRACALPPYPFILHKFMSKYSFNVSFYGSPMLLQSRKASIILLFAHSIVWHA